MSSTLTVIQPTLPVERRELLIEPAAGDRLESVQTLYHHQEILVDGLCYTFAEYQHALRQVEADGYQITNKSCTPIVRGLDAWVVQITGIKPLRYSDEGQFEFHIQRR